MVRSKHLEHPAVELELPLDGGHRRFAVPGETTLFFRGALAVGVPDRIPRIRSRLGHRLFTAGVETRERVSWTVSIDGVAVPLVADSYYRKAGYAGLAWWIALEPVELPTSVRVHFETDGDPPTEGEEPIVLWTGRGDPIRWGTASESTIELTPSPSPPSEFPTRREELWGEHTVYVPREVTVE